MKYLKITLHGKDFYEELICLGRYIADRVENCLFDADKIDDDFRKSIIEYMLWCRAWSKKHCGGFPADKELSDIREYIDEHLQIEVVDGNNVCSSDNDDTLYIILNDYKCLERWFII